MKPSENKQVKKIEVPMDDLPPNAKLSFDNDGNIVLKNRAFRRKPTKMHLKSSQLRKKGKRKK